MKEALEQSLDADRHFVTALARGIQILRCFTQNQDELRVSEIARITGLPQPTVWRLCHTLIRLNYLQSSKSGDRLRLGIGALALGYSAFSRVETYAVFKPAMERIAEKYGVAVSLGAPDGLRMIYLQRCRGTSAFGRDLHVGSRVPILNTALGWAYLATLPSHERTDILDQLIAENPDLWRKLEPSFNHALRDCAEKGYLLNLGAFQSEINAVAVPIVSRDGGNRLALNCSGLASALSKEMLEQEIAPQLREIADTMKVYIQSRYA
jgi:DNA-binding IclR family transcriptional regulator